MITFLPFLVSHKNIFNKGKLSEFALEHSIIFHVSSKCRCILKYLKMNGFVNYSHMIEDKPLNKCLEIKKEEKHIIAWNIINSLLMKIMQNLIRGGFTFWCNVFNFSNRYLFLWCHLTWSFCQIWAIFRIWNVPALFIYTKYIKWTFLLSLIFWKFAGVCVNILFKVIYINIKIIVFVFRALGITLSNIKASHLSTAMIEIFIVHRRWHKKKPSQTNN